MLGIVPASAQLLSCFVTSAVPIVRGEGIAELTGDVRVQCVLPPGDPVPAYPYLVTDFSVELNTKITSRLDFGYGTDITDAVLVLNENSFAFPAATSVFDGSGSDPEVPIPQYGRRVSDTRLEWLGVNVPIPQGPRPGGGAFPLVTQLRWTNIRANVAALGLPNVFPSPPPISATIASESNPSLSFTQTNLMVGVQILALMPSVQPAADGAMFNVRLAEGFAAAFKVLGFPTYQTISQTRPFEAGYCTPGSGSAPAVVSLPGGDCVGGGATHGTRFLLTFPDALPKHLFVPDVVAGTGNLQLTRVSGAAQDGSGGTLAMSAAVKKVDGSVGNRFAVYEVTDTNPAMNEQVEIPVYSKSQNGQGAGNTWTFWKVRVNVAFAPLSSVEVSDAAAPVPRFAHSGVQTLFATPGVASGFDPKSSAGGATIW